MRTTTSLRTAELRRAHRLIADLTIKLIGLRDRISQQEPDGPIEEIVRQSYRKLRSTTEIIQAVILDRADAKATSAAASVHREHHRAA